MAVRIRVNPGGTIGNPNLGMGYGAGIGSPAWAQQYYGQKERQTKQTAKMSLQYERALWKERLETAKLQTAMQFSNPYGGMGLGGMGLGGYGGMLGGFGGVRPMSPFGFSPAASVGSPFLGSSVFGSGFMGGLLGGII